MSIKDSKEGYPEERFDLDRRTGTQDFRAGSRRSRRRSKKRRSRASLAGVIIIFCAIVAILVAADYWINSGKIYRGVEVGNIALGGETPDQAQKTIRERTNGALKEFHFTGPQEFTRTASQMGVDFRVSDTVDEAYAVGRQGSLPERLRDRLKAAYSTVTISPTVDYQQKKALAQVQDIAAKLDKKPKEASITIYGSEVKLVESQEGYKTDTSTTAKNVNDAVDNMSGDTKIVGTVLKPEINTKEAQAAATKAKKAVDEQLVLTAEGQQWTLSPAQIGNALDVSRQDGTLKVSLNEARLREGLANVYDGLTVQPVEASYAVNGSDVSVQPGQTGVRVEDKKFINAIESGIFTGKRQYEVPTVKNEPDLTTAEAEKLKPTDLLSTYRTNYMTYDDSPGRVKNLKIASDAVSGTLLAPGEIFSFNALAEPLDYYDTKVIVKGKVDTAEGGGLCQVSSTLYMAANYAGLDVIERSPHYAELPYIQPGFDATVWFGAIDMKFQNTSPGYVLLQEWVDSDGYVNANIYGKPSGIDVDMRSRKVKEYDDDEGNPVTKWVTYQKITENDKVVYDGVLHTDTYKYLKPAEKDAPYDKRPVN